MSNLTNYGENKVADMLRGQGLTLPTAWRLTPLSAASDSSVTEMTGSGLARFSMTRNLTNWKSTQGDNIASSGSTKTTSNSVLIDMGTATAAIGTVSHVGLFDASSGGNCWAYAPLSTPIVTANGVAVQIAIDNLAFTLGLGGSMTDYLVNKLIDLFFRGQAYTYPSSAWLAAVQSGGSEVGGGVGYARFQLPSTLTDISGTQGAGTTSASTGTSGRISNNATLIFASPSGSWGDIATLDIFDASMSGNRLWSKTLATTKTIGVSYPLTFQPDKLGFTFA
jgi:hypothetical protein